MFKVSSQGEVNPNYWKYSKSSKYRSLIIVLNDVTRLIRLKSMSLTLGHTHDKHQAQSNPRSRRA